MHEDKERLIEDFNFLVEKLRSSHITTYEGLRDDKAQIIKTIEDTILRSSSLEYDQFVFLMNDLVVAFNDSHTRLRIPFKKGDEYINLECVWILDGIYILKDKHHFRAGDKILSIGGKEEEELMNALKRIIPHENEYIIKSKAFNDYNKISFLMSGLVLNKLGLVKCNGVEICVLRDKCKYTYAIAFEHYINERENEEWLGYSIDNENNLGVFRLHECRYNETYKSKLNKFFKDIYKYDIGNIALDLSENMGGDARVINEFLSYMNIDECEDYAYCERFSEDLLESYRRHLGDEVFNKVYSDIQEEYREVLDKNINKNEKTSDKKLIFKGKVYVITSNKTYSGGRYFAVILRDNKIARIVGEPTGGKPSSFGNVVRFKMKNTGIHFSISTKRFIRPDRERSGDESLYPDIVINSQIGDLIGGVDTQIEGLKVYIHEERNR